MRQTARITLGGVLGALSFICMLLTVFPFATYALPALAGTLLLPLALETSARWGFLTYGMVALLTALFAPSLEAKVLFIGFFGYYPVLKLLLDRLHRPVAWLLKLLVFNVTMVLAYLLLLFVFHLDAETFVIFGVNLPLVFLAAGNVVFGIYDLALSNIIKAYQLVWHDRLRRLFRHG